MGLKEMIAADIAKRNSQKKPSLMDALRNSARVIDDGLLGGRIGQIPAEANRLMQRAKAAPGELNALASPEMNQQIQQAMSRPAKINPQQWIDKGMELTGMAPIGGLVGATVYHGSPHKFDKFDISKIGTGEGAQAYGHGLYFAEAPAVAKEYQRNLAAKGMSIDGVPIESTLENYTIQQLVGEHGQDLSKLKVKLSEYANKNAGNPYADVKSASKIIDAIDRKAFDPKGGGALYKVDIPDESIPRMLDWDAPLSKQPEGVRVAVQDLGLAANATGKDAYNALANLARDGAIARGNNAATTLGGSQSAASVDLQGYGIPGIRYLDGNSRSKNQWKIEGPSEKTRNKWRVEEYVTGNKNPINAASFSGQKEAQAFYDTNALPSSNYVLFDDQLPRILETNGVPTGATPWPKNKLWQK